MNNTEGGAIGRFGYVSAYDAKKHMARVQFPDKNNLVSDWLPVVVPNTKKNRDELHLDIGEHVYCILQGNGLEAGIILGSIYDDKNKPVVANENIRSVTFGDGTVIKYDRKSKLLDIHCVGDINIHADGKFKLTATKVDLN